MNRWPIHFRPPGFRERYSTENSGEVVQILKPLHLLELLVLTGCAGRQRFGYPNAAAPSGSASV